MVSAWSFSRRKDFNQCPARFELKYVKKIAEPQRPLRPGQTEQANDRGSRVHDAAEQYVKSPALINLIPELSEFRPEFQRLRELYAEGKVNLEEEWGYDDAWQPVGWFDPKVWARIKLDAFVRESEQHGVVIDYKTGKRDGKEVEHSEQGQLYAVAALLRYPEIEKFTVEFWYVDVPDIYRQVYTRAQAMRYLATFNKEGLKITTATSFPARPNGYNCRFCMYGPKGSSVCAVGV